ncbi:M56 family metallopeptidase [Bogoriella caseilytica]|uniref:Peptidase M48-like protein n=1 Tax=Bogoriella caseilytica TaxID=56055 RepID=A0A3N2BC48_9MICO|nr:M56 family metallopeptidase [Bogoriella caseilytica]ROR72836.1 peptidase M48-like protein [Bogoriella caseilytica]
MTALVLTALALLLSLFAPVLLRRARWLRRSPAAAIVLWQAVALAAVLAALGALLAAPEEILRTLHGGEITFGPALIAGAAAAFLLAGAVIVRLAVVTIRLAVHTRRRRKRHVGMLDLLQGAEEGDRHQLHVLAARLPLAYCVPGSPGRIVLTDAALDLLDEHETEAVIAHERAHLAMRHDLVTEAFTALHAAFPRWVRSRLALEEVGRLLEMLADDATVRSQGAAPVRSALEKLAATSEDGENIRVRLARLHSPSTAAPRAAAAAAYVLAVAVLAVPTLAVVTPWLRSAMNALVLG